MKRDTNLNFASRLLVACSIEFYRSFDLGLGIVDFQGQIATIQPITVFRDDKI